MKVSELTDAKLDYWVAKAEGVEVCIVSNNVYPHIVRRVYCGSNYVPSSDWSQGGPIIEANHIRTYENTIQNTWSAYKIGMTTMDGKTLLEAAMRAYVASKYGEEVPEIAQ